VLVEKKKKILTVLALEKRAVTARAGLSPSDHTPFNHFIDDNFLVDLPMCGRNFT
jgi:hypothetical protein